MHLQMTVVWTDGRRPPLEVIVDSPRGTTSSELLASLRDRSDVDMAKDSIHVARQALSGAEVIGEGTLVDGAVLTVGPARQASQVKPGHRPPGGPLRLAVVSGPDA